MTKTDFAELKEKLTKIDYVDANAYLTRYMEGGYVEPTYQQYGDYIHGKSAAIISELIDIIESQSEALKYVIADKIWPIIEAKKALSETTTRLQKLRDGK